MFTNSHCPPTLRNGTICQLSAARPDWQKIWVDMTGCILLSTFCFACDCHLLNYFHFLTSISCGLFPKFNNEASTFPEQLPPQSPLLCLLLLLKTFMLWPSGNNQAPLIHGLPLIPCEVQEANLLRAFILWGCPRSALIAKPRALSYPVQWNRTRVLATFRITASRTSIGLKRTQPVMGLFMAKALLQLPGRLDWLRVLLIGYELISRLTLKIQVHYEQKASAIDANLQTGGNW